MDITEPVKVVNMTGDSDSESFFSDPPEHIEEPPEYSEHALRLLARSKKQVEEGGRPINLTTTQLARLRGAGDDDFDDYEPGTQAQRLG